MCLLDHGGRRDSSASTTLATTPTTTTSTASSMRPHGQRACRQTPRRFELHLLSCLCHFLSVATKHVRESVSAGDTMPRSAHKQGSTVCPLDHGGRRDSAATTSTTSAALSLRPRGRRAFPWPSRDDLSSTYLSFATSSRPTRPRYTPACALHC